MELYQNINTTKHNSHQTYNLQQAADFLGLHQQTVRQRVLLGEIPGAKVGRCWMFLIEDLVSYLRSLYPSEASQGAIQRSKTIWHSINAKVSGGLISPIRDSEYDAALGQKSK